MFPEPFIFLGIPIHFFGVFAALSILAGYLITASEMKRLDIPTYFLADLALAVLLSAFLGARLFFIAEHWPLYAASPLKIFKFWEGGIVLYGGLLGGLLGGFLFCRARKLSFAELSDPVALGLCLGLAFSRMGCLAAGCCYGKPTALPWGIIFKSPLAIARPLHVPLHPTQVYSFLAGIVIFIFLMAQRKRKVFNGQILLTYFLLESGSRILVEFFRADSYFMTPLLVFSIFVFSGVLNIQFQVKNKERGERLMMKPTFKLTSLIFVIAFLAACALIKTEETSRGLDIKASDVDRIQKGGSTEKDILLLFGPPTKWRDTAEGKEFFYEYSRSGGPQWNVGISVGGGTTTKTLVVWFDKNGVVTDYSYKTS